MAEIVGDVGLRNLLKVVHRNKGPENLLLKNDPLLRSLTSERIDGKEYRFSGLAGRGGAVSASYDQAYAAANKTVNNVEWHVKPGFLNSPFSLTQNEILASRDKTGGYMKATGEKVFASLSAMRQILAKALYGTGYGELGQFKSAGTLTVGDNTLEFDEPTIAGMDIGTTFHVADTTPDGTLGVSINTVTAIDGKSVSFTATAADTYAIGDYVVLTGSRDASGNPLLPIGLGGWLPSINRTAAIANSFYDVDRSILPDRLAGHFVQQSDLPSGATKIDTINELFRRCIRYGTAEFSAVYMNDINYAELLSELRQNERLLQQVSGTSPDKKSAANGFNEVAYAFSSSWIGKTIPSPYIPYNTFYVLEKDSLQILTYTNVDKITKESISGNEPGKETPETYNGETEVENAGTRINLDDLITIEPGARDAYGPSIVVSYRFIGTFVLWNTSGSGVGLFS